MKFDVLKPIFEGKRPVILGFGREGKVWLFTPIGELAQFGQMLANGGIYNGRTLLGEESLKAMETNQLRDDMRDFCWDHGGKRVAYGAGCPDIRILPLSPLLLPDQ